MRVNWEYRFNEGNFFSLANKIADKLKGRYYKTAPASLVLKFVHDQRGEVEVPIVFFSNISREGMYLIIDPDHLFYGRNRCAVLLDGEKYFATQWMWADHLTNCPGVVFEKRDKHIGNENDTTIVWEHV